VDSTLSFSVQKPLRAGGEAGTTGGLWPLLLHRHQRRRHPRRLRQRLRRPEGEENNDYDDGTIDDHCQCKPGNDNIEFNITGGSADNDDNVNNNDGETGYKDDNGTGDCVRKWAG